MKALVTGGSGFLGSHIADALSRSGIDVTILDLIPSAFCGPDQKMIVGDILERDVLRTALEGSDFVFHLAGLADLNAGYNRPVETAKLNVLGTLQLLEEAKNAGVKRFMFSSTVYVYSRQGGFYRCSKQACENYIEEYSRQFQMEYTILRYGSLYGPRSNNSNGFYRLLSQAFQTGSIEYVGSPEDIREYVHVEDAAQLSVEALAPEYANQHVIITGYNSMRISDLFTVFSEILGKPLNVTYISPNDARGTGHYSVTPYAFHPRPGRKLSANPFVDMGQGILQVIEQLYEADRLSVNPVQGSQ